MIEIVAAHDVKLGMFVVELDRPWLGTPFAIQGFLVSNERQIEALREYCSFVSVDRGRSVYGEFAGDVQVRKVAHDRGRALVDLFRSVSASDQRITLGAARKPPGAVTVAVAVEAAPPVRPALGPRGSMSTSQPTPPRSARRPPSMGRMESVPVAKKRPNLQPHREDFGELARVVDTPLQSRLSIPRRTVYIDRTASRRRCLCPARPSAVSRN